MPRHITVCFVLEIHLTPRIEKIIYELHFNKISIICTTDLSKLPMTAFESLSSTSVYKCFLCSFFMIPSYGHMCTYLHPVYRHYIFNLI